MLVNMLNRRDSQRSRVGAILIKGSLWGVHKGMGYIDKFWSVQKMDCIKLTISKVSPITSSKFHTPGHVNSYGYCETQDLTISE